MTKLFTLLVVVTSLSSSLAVRGGGKAGHVHSADCDDSHPTQDSLCWNLAKGWLDPWDHSHFRDGTPLIHSFGFEPAFLGRDLFVDYTYASLEEGIEHEMEIELEWALTQRIGIVLEQGYTFERPDSGPDAEGWGDFAFVPRIVLSDCDRCILSANLEIVAPTGSKEIGAGDGWSLAPFLNSWCDLGNWWSLAGQAGVEFGLEEDESEFFFAIGLAKAIQLAETHSAVDAHGHGHKVPTGILSLIAEVSGSVVLDGDAAEEGLMALEGLLGVSFGAAPFLDLRAGYLFPLNDNSELDGGFTIGAIHHF